jgi:hypothetical protein
MKKVLAFLFVFMLVATTAYAGGPRRSRSHDHYYDDGNSPSGVGVDALIHQVGDADLVAEYRFDTANDEHSIFGVVKIRKSLVEYAKELLGNDTEE